LLVIPELLTGPIEDLKTKAITISGKILLSPAKVEDKDADLDTVLLYNSELDKQSNQPGLHIT
jgi:hypothetical protein